MAGGRDLVQFLISTGSEVSTAAKHALVQTPAAPKHAAAPHRSVVRYEAKPPPLFGWQTAESAVDQRNVPAREPPEIRIPIGA
jgi:hypothetical protein